MAISIGELEEAAAGGWRAPEEATLLRPEPLPARRLCGPPWLPLPHRSGRTLTSAMRRSAGQAAQARRRGRLNRRNSNFAPLSNANTIRNGSVMMSRISPRIITTTSKMADNMPGIYPARGFYA